MWIFTPQGLLMPAAVPLDKADKNFTKDGQFDFQIRGRVAEHLQNFIDAYMEPGTFNPEIQLTPDMDYNARFYTTREAFAAAMTKALLDLNYEKFKPQAYDHDRKDHPYYNALNSIWGTVTMLGKPGGKWAVGRGRPFVGSTFYDADWGKAKDFEKKTDRWSETLPEFSDMDYTPTIEQEIDDILEEVRDLPVEQWRDYLNDHEWDLVKSIAKARMSVTKRERRRTRQARPRYSRTGR